MQHCTIRLDKEPKRITMLNITDSPRLLRAGPFWLTLGMRLPTFHLFQQPHDHGTRFHGSMYFRFLGTWTPIFTRAADRPAPTISPHHRTPHTM
ncbi:hypothetical protein HPB49_014472 [Dermacentor silvarum]|uniref:Uncharacterized protein n=1 Tax=Dermacentor silvarum TaxID=543639 RepID=A0ACB8E187_DERSI|nr:hypothetical protein HPB49_014472 [Dermacentor silvarum]